MLDEKLARLRAHRNNISRYRRLLGTRLTDCERQFIERRLAEESCLMESLAVSAFPLTLPIGRGCETPAAEAMRR
jgi:hypothetical protein